MPEKVNKPIIVDHYASALAKAKDGLPLNSRERKAMADQAAKMLAFKRRTRTRDNAQEIADRE